MHQSLQYLAHRSIKTLLTVVRDMIIIPLGGQWVNRRVHGLAPATET